MRLAAAGMVLVSHSFPLGGFGAEPLAAVIGGQETLGGVAVATFFVLSGFLVTRSILNAPQVGRFLWRRALRILPGYWVCLLVTAFAFGALFWWHAHGTVTGFLSQPDGPFRYMERNWLVLIRQWDLGGLEHNPSPGINGSLWTLIDEVRCYVVLALLAGLGVIHKRRAPVLLALLLVWWIASVRGLPVRTGIWFPLGNHFLAVHFLAFTVGAAACVYSHRLPVHWGACAAAALLLVVLLATNTYAMFGIFPLAYIVLFLSVTLPLTSINTSTDISYGVYIYAFPVQQSLAAFGVAGAGLVPFFGLTVVITTGLALLSWKLVEKPMMQLR